MVIKRIKIILFALLVTVIMAFQGNSPETAVSTILEKASICSIDNRAFQHGEEITYKLYYNWNFVWLAAGEVVFKVMDQGDQYYISAKGRTYSSYEWFFKVRDHYECYIDKETLLPTTSIRNVHEGKYRLYDKMTFDQKNLKITSLRGKTKEVAEQKDFSVKNCMHDILSIIYYTRNLDFENFRQGQEFPIQIFMDKEVQPLKVKYDGKEKEKRIKGKGRFNTIKFTPEVIVGDIFNDGAKMNVYVSDDANRIPLMIESPVSVGYVKVVLKDYKGLKHDLTSKLN